MGAPLPLQVLRQQPAQNAQVDGNNPITAGLLSAVLGHQVPGFGSGPNGRYMAKSGSGGFQDPNVAASTTSTNGTLTGLNQITFVALVRRTNANGSNQNFAIRYRVVGNTNSVVLGLYLKDYSSNRSIYFTGPGASATITTTAPASPVPDTLFVAGVWDRVNNTQTLYVDGQAPVTVAATSAIIPSGSHALFLGDANSGSTNTAFNPYATLVFGRALAPTEIESLRQNIWQAWKAPASVLNFALMAPAAVVVPKSYVLQVAAASFSLTGAQGKLSVSRRLVGAVGAIMMSAASALVTVGRRLGAGVGSFTVSGVPAALRVARKLPAAPASFALSGTGAAIRAARRLPAQAGAFALTGSAAQMVYTPKQGAVGPTYTLGAAAGSFSLTGSPARLALARRLRAVLGAFALTGAAARLPAARRIRADTGGFAIAGSAAVLKYTGSAGRIDVSQIPPSRLVIFDGSGSRIASFSGSGSRVAVFAGSGARTNLNGVNVKLPTLVGTKMTVDRDPDEISYYGADITQELLDRATTAKSVELVLLGVVQKALPDIQVVAGDAGSRTYVVAFLGGTDSDPPDGWKWVARVTCANGERFDKTTWFNKVDP